MWEGNVIGLCFVLCKQTNKQTKKKKNITSDKQMNK